MLIRRRGDDAGFREPKTTRYPEKTLEDVLTSFPTLLPGFTSYPVVVARQLGIPDMGSADICVVGADGRIMIVECKLRANREIKKHVIGQVLAYAAGLWNLGYERFDRLIERRIGQPLVDAMTKTVAEYNVRGELPTTEELEEGRSPLEFEEEAFRKAVGENLRAGRIQLVVAVDLITPELKTIVEFVNQHSASTVELLALELAYAADEDIEIVVPRVYGEKSGAGADGPGWTEERFVIALADVERSVRSVIDRLMDSVRDRDGYFRYGKGLKPSASAHFVIADLDLSVWSCYLSRQLVEVNFAILRNTDSSENLRNLAKSLREVPLNWSNMDGLEEKDFRQVPYFDVARLEDEAIFLAFVRAIDSYIALHGTADDSTPQTTEGVKE